MSSRPSRGRFLSRPQSRPNAAGAQHFSCGDVQPSFEKQVLYQTLCGETMHQVYNGLMVQPNQLCAVSVHQVQLCDEPLLSCAGHHPPPSAYFREGTQAGIWPTGCISTSFSPSGVTWWQPSDCQNVPGSWGTWHPGRGRRGGFHRSRSGFRRNGPPWRDTHGAQQDLNLSIEQEPLLMIQHPSTQSRQLIPRHPSRSDHQFYDFDHEYDTCSYTPSSLDQAELLRAGKYLKDQVLEMINRENFKDREICHAAVRGTPIFPELIASICFELCHDDDLEEPLYSLWDKIKDWGSSGRLECAKHYEKIFGDLFYDYGKLCPNSFQGLENDDFQECQLRDLDARYLGIQIALSLKDQNARQGFVKQFNEEEAQSMQNLMFTLLEQPSLSNQCRECFEDIRDALEDSWPDLYRHHLKLVSYYHRQLTGAPHGNDDDPGPAPTYVGGSRRTGRSPPFSHSRPNLQWGPHRRPRRGFGDYHQGEW